METVQRNRQIANAYYNLGLEKAKERDLTGAVAELKRSLRFDKFQTDARNLLGLIYNELGEVGAALTQWVISMNLQETNNLAEEYLNKVRNARGYLEVADQAAKKYNQALIYARNENEDLAVLLLMRMLDEFPSYVKAQQLLALLYVHQEDYIKAGRCLYQAMKIDKYNPLAQRYMMLAKKNTGRAEVEKRKLKNAFSHRQMQDDDIILPPSYKENTGLQELREQLEQLNQRNIEIDQLNGQLEDARGAQESAEASLAALVSDNGGVLSQYQNLVKILQAYRDEDMRTAALLYVTTDMAVLEDGVLNATVEWIHGDMAQNGYEILMVMGDEAMNRREGAVQAIDLYQKSLQIRSDNPEVIYKLGMAYKASGDEDTANRFFGDVIMNYHDSDYAEDAKIERGY